MPEFFGQSERGGLWLPKALVGPRRNWLLSLEGKQIGEKIWEIKEPKSHQQIKTIFGLIVARIVGEMTAKDWDTSYLLGDDVPSGVPITVGFMKHYLYAVCPLVNEEGERITLSHKDAQKPNVSVWMQMIMDWSQKKWNIYIPDPDPSRRNKE